MESTWALISGNPSVCRERVGGQARGALQQTGLSGPSPAPHWKLWWAQPGFFPSWVLVSHAGAGEVGGGGAHWETGDGVGSHTHLQGLIHDWRDSIQLTHWQGLGCVSACDQQFVEPHAGFPCRKGKGGKPQ